MNQNISIPTWGSGFARGAYESEAPEFWNRLVGAWVPSLGPTGSSLKNIARDFRGADGTLTNMDPATDWIIGEHGYHLDFDGSNDWVDLGQKGFIDNQKNWSIAGLVKLDVTNTDQAIIWKGPSAFNQNGSFSIFFDDTEGASGNTNVFNFIFRVESKFVRAVTATNFVSADVWYLVVGVAKFGVASKIYVNGKDETSFTTETNTDALNILAENEALGSNSDGDDRFLNGQLGFVMLFERDLTAIEAKNLYSDPFAWLRLKPRSQRVLVPVVVPPATPPEPGEGQPFHRRFWGIPGHAGHNSGVQN